MLDRQVSGKQKPDGKRPDRSAEDANAAALVGELIARARKAQAIANRYDQAMADLLVAAAGWAIMEPSRNRMLAELAVADTGLGNVPDKFRRTIARRSACCAIYTGAKSIGVIASDEEPASSRSRARSAWWRRSRHRRIRPRRPRTRSSTRSKCGNAVIVAPSPKGYRRARTLVEFIHARVREGRRSADLVQLLPASDDKAATPS